MANGEWFYLIWTASRGDWFRNEPSLLRVPLIIGVVFLNAIGPMSIETINFNHNRRIGSYGTCM